MCQPSQFTVIIHIKNYEKLPMSRGVKNTKNKNNQSCGLLCGQLANGWRRMRNKMDFAHQEKDCIIFLHRQLKVFIEKPIMIGLHRLTILLQTEETLQLLCESTTL